MNEDGNGEWNSVSSLVDPSHSHIPPISPYRLDINTNITYTYPPCRHPSLRSFSLFPCLIHLNIIQLVSQSVNQSVIARLSDRLSVRLLVCILTRSQVTKKSRRGEVKLWILSCLTNYLMIAWLIDASINFTNFSSFASSLLPLLSLSSVL